MATEPIRTAPEPDPTAATRKQDHIELAFQSQVAAAGLDERFYYEPMLSAHPQSPALRPFSFLGKTLHSPLWVSSMTGGTALAKTINANLARACAEFGMGMGLGSCRQLLYSDDMLADFAVRDTLGTDLPLFANLGVAQIEQLFARRETERIPALLTKLRADGLIIHVNPLQEAM
ncbi:MAG: isopentenyl-diphosphate delta-isomerase, partial [Saprospiraceae bacterium]